MAADPTQEDEFWQALESQRRDLARTAFKLARQFDDVEDLVQHTLVQAFERRRQFDGRNLRAWCLAILRNEFRDRLRSWWSRLVDYDSDIDEIAIRALPDAEDRVMLGEVVEALRQMGGNCLDVLLLTAKGYKLREMSELLDVPIGTLGRQASQCRDRLDRKLGLDQTGQSWASHRPPTTH